MEMNASLDVLTSQPCSVYAEHGPMNMAMP